MHSNLPILHLHEPLSVIEEENFTAKDFSIIHEQFAKSQNDLTDLQSRLSVISQTAIDWDDVKHAINMLTSTKTDNANMSEVATDLQTFAHHILLLALSEITSPFFTFLLTILQVLCFIWAIVLTIKFFRNDTPNILCRVKSAATYLHSKLKCNQTDTDATTSEDVPPLNRTSSHDHFGSTNTL